VLSSEGAGHRIAVIGVAIVADDLGTERGGGIRQSLVAGPYYARQVVAFSDQDVRQDVHSGSADQRLRCRFVHRRRAGKYP